jgi:hypothetical protein
MGKAARRRSARHAPALVLAALLAVAPAAADVEPPPPPEAPAAPSPPSPPPEPTALDRYQECFQQMVDAGENDNAFMRKCLGLPERSRTPAKPPSGEGLASEDVLADLRKNEPGARSCYDELARRKPKASGRALVEARVDALGQVAKVFYRELTLGDTAFKSCLAAQVKSWRFPKPRGGAATTVNLPFVFAPPH